MNSNIYDEHENGSDEEFYDCKDGNSSSNSDFFESPKHFQNLNIMDEPIKERFESQLNNYKNSCNQSSLNVEKHF